jgi:hypothetical protein
MPNKLLKATIGIGMTLFFLLGTQCDYADNGVPNTAERTNAAPAPNFVDVKGTCTAPYSPNQFGITITGLPLTFPGFTTTLTGGLCTAAGEVICFFSVPCFANRGRMKCMPDECPAGTLSSARFYDFPDRTAVGTFTFRWTITCDPSWPLTTFQRVCGAHTVTVINSMAPATVAACERLGIKTVDSTLRCYQGSE